MWHSLPSSFFTASRRAIWLAVAAVLCVVFSGCGKSGHQLSGAATFDGKPIPKGSISIAPDGAKGNSGPAVVAEIKDGKYTTDGTEGIVGGACVVQISGYDGVPVESGEGSMNEMGTALFPTYTEKVDLPAENATHDFNVPADAAKE
jgi:hypothetical protein